jgi:hypothetical protein
VVWLTSVACLSPPVAKVKTNVTQQTPIRVPQNEKNQVDILFLVDNSPSMLAMQDELKQKFKQFFKVFADQATLRNYADLNIGVVTSDYGAGQQDNRGVDPTTGATVGCAPSPGDGGRLQTTAAAHQPNSGCAGPVGLPFIHYAFGADGPTSNLPAGATLDDTFTCIASVGANGCGFEHQLESVYAALTNTHDNGGFVRDGALLAIVFLTNEDDGSAPPMTHIFDSKGGDAFGAYDTYRQTRYGVACGSPLALAPYGVASLLDGCVPAENDNMVQLGQEYDVSRYANLLLSDKAQHGIKDNALDNVVLVGIDAPETPFSIIEANGTTGTGAPSQPTYQPCVAGQAPGTGSCVYRLQHSCQNHAAPGFFGDPPVRLNSVIKRAKHYRITSICGDNPEVTPDYSSALEDVAQLITGLLPGCIPAPLADVAHPDCVVEDVTSDGNGKVVSQRELPLCTLDAAFMPEPSNQFPCWAVVPNSQCQAPRSPQGVGVTIFRHDVPAPLNTSAHVECSTIAGPPA